MEITRSELVGWMFEDAPAAIDYWVRDALFDSRNGVFEIGETEDWYTEKHGNIIVTLTQFEKAITDWCTNHAKGHAYKYYDTFAKNWLWGDYVSVDYDAEVIDQIFQWAAFGEIRYG